MEQKQKSLQFFCPNAERASEEWTLQPRKINVRDAAVAATLKDKQTHCVL